MIQSQTVCHSAVPNLLTFCGTVVPNVHAQKARQHIVLSHICPFRKLYVERQNTYTHTHTYAQPGALAETGAKEIVAHGATERCAHPAAVADVAGIAIAGSISGSLSVSVCTLEWRARVCWCVCVRAYVCVFI